MVGSRKHACVATANWKVYFMLEKYIPVGKWSQTTI